ncbi:hypothetical protein [Scytonema sp. PRP1]
MSVQLYWCAWRDGTECPPAAIATLVFHSHHLTGKVFPIVGKIEVG